MSVPAKKLQDLASAELEFCSVYMTLRSDPDLFWFCSVTCKKFNLTIVVFLQQNGANSTLTRVWRRPKGISKKMLCNTQMFQAQDLVRRHLSAPEVGNKMAASSSLHVFTSTQQ